MNYYSFLLPGDQITVDNQSIHFHKNESYTVSHVFHDKGEPIIFLKDKNNFDIKIKHYYEEFQMTSDTRKASNRRMLLERLKELAQSSDNEGRLSIGLGGKDSIYYKIIDATRTYNNTIYGGREKLFYLLSYTKDDNGLIKNNPEQTFLTLELLCDFIEKEIKRNKEEYYMFHVNGAGFDKRERLDFKSYLLSYNIPVINESNLNLPKMFVESSYGTKIYLQKLPLEEAVFELTDLLFDTKKPNTDQKQLICTIIDAFIASPPSHGATATTKLLLGKSKKVSEKQIQFSGLNPMGLKQAKLFIIVDWVETFCYLFKAFTSDKELHMEQTNVEFTARGINKKVIDEIKALLK